MEFAGETENILRFWVGSLLSILLHMRPKFVWEEDLIILEVRYMQTAGASTPSKCSTTTLILTSLIFQFSLRQATPSTVRTKSCTCQEKGPA